MKNLVAVVVVVCLLSVEREGERKRKRGKVEVQTVEAGEKPEWKAEESREWKNPDKQGRGKEEDLRSVAAPRERKGTNCVSKVLACINVGVMFETFQDFVIEWFFQRLFFPLMI